MAGARLLRPGAQPPQMRADPGRGVRRPFPGRREGSARASGHRRLTAAAIAAIAFDRRATAVDGNVERVVARLFAIEDPLPGAKPEIHRLACELTPDRRPGDHAQAMMDLGATVCTSRSPDCGRCPLAGDCAASRAGIADRLPARAPKQALLRATARRSGGVADGAVLLGVRAETGFWGLWRSRPPLDEEPPRGGKRDPGAVEADWRLVPGEVRHTFTHFRLELAVMEGRVGEGWREAHGLWVPVERLGDHALPTVMKKVVRQALSDSPPR